MEFVKIESVKCDECGELHDLGGESFISFHGNVTVGAKGGIYGNAKGDKITVLCKKEQCFSKLYAKIGTGLVIPNEIEEISEDLKLKDLTSKETETETLEKEEDVTVDDKKSEKKDAAFDPTLFDDKK